MKIGMNCHKDYSHIMGNSQNIQSGDVKVSYNGVTFHIPISCYTKKGVLRKKYKHLVAEAYLRTHRKRVAA